MVHIPGHFSYTSPSDISSQVTGWRAQGVSSEEINRRLANMTQGGGIGGIGGVGGVGGVGGGGDAQTSFFGPQDILAEAPKATFFSFQDQFGGAPTQRRHFQGQFQDIYNQYLGTLGQQLRQDTQAGRAPSSPSASFLDFMGDFDFSQQFGQIPPSIRGGTTGRFAPPARFLNF